jgi:hypothetical protein
MGDIDMFEALEAIGMNVIVVDESTFKPPVVHEFGENIRLDPGERPVIILALETYLQDYEDNFIFKDEGITWADYEVFVDVYRSMLRIYYAFTGRDFFGSHGYITNFARREEVTDSGT